MRKQYDFSKVETHQLAIETLRRARDVHSVNENVFSSLFIAYLWLAGGALVSGTIIYSLGPGYLKWCVIGLIVVTLIGAIRWFIACWNCNEYTREMNARSEELKRRNALVEEEI